MNIKIVGFHKPKTPIEHPRYIVAGRLSLSCFESESCLVDRLVTLDPEGTLLIVSPFAKEASAIAYEREICQSVRSVKRVVIIDDCEIYL